MKKIIDSSCENNTHNEKDEYNVISTRACLSLTTYKNFGTHLMKFCRKILLVDDC